MKATDDINNAASPRPGREAAICLQGPSIIRLAIAFAFLFIAITVPSIAFALVPLSSGHFKHRVHLACISLRSFLSPATQDFRLFVTLTIIHSTLCLRHIQQDAHQVMLTCLSLQSYWLSVSSHELHNLQKVATREGKHLTDSISIEIGCGR